MQPQVSITSNSPTLIPTLMAEYLDCSKPELFELGRIACTQNIASWAEINLPDVLLENNLWLNILIRAHNTGCWSELDEHDQQQNRHALEPGNEGRIFSAYTILGEKIYVITEWDRSVTTVLLAEDY